MEAGTVVRDVMGHKLHVGDIAIASIQNEQVVVRVISVEQHEPGNPGTVARVSVLKYAAGKIPLIKTLHGSQLIWYSSDYRKVPDRYAIELFVHESRHSDV